MVDEFYEFLELNGYLEKFHYAFEERNSLSDLNPRMYLHNFIWEDTTEGPDFWSAVDKQWMSYLEYWEGDFGKRWYEAV